MLAATGERPPVRMREEARGRGTDCDRQVSTLQHRADPPHPSPQHVCAVATSSGWIAGLSQRTPRKKKEDIFGTPFPRAFVETRGAVSGEPGRMDTVHASDRRR